MGINTVVDVEAGATVGRNTVVEVGAAVVAMTLPKTLGMAGIGWKMAGIHRGSYPQVPYPQWWTGATTWESAALESGSEQVAERPESERIVENLQQDGRREAAALSHTSDYVSGVQLLSQDFPGLVNAVSPPTCSNFDPATANAGNGWYAGGGQDLLELRWSFRGIETQKPRNFFSRSTEKFLSASSTLASCRNFKVFQPRGASKLSTCVLDQVGCKRILVPSSRITTKSQTNSIFCPLLLPSA